MSDSGGLVSRGGGWQRRGMGAARVHPNSGSDAKMKEQEPEAQGGNGYADLIL